MDYINIYCPYDKNNRYKCREYRPNEKGCCIYDDEECNSKKQRIRLLKEFIRKEKHKNLI